ncbi:DUF2806 domain-containing protein [Luteimonas sp. M1R5S18]|uniref:DUF2806 domain-containing protein n=1 Tax=Luteimonas rhizosphaericola TaxID=3042024 RepID=A0ABT6JQ94_9GAMM|nr:DUF2806 domain-containing protein [Luteimonas rhizosphaericola]MDH5832131.1 DUF2806 domain-containing protein [Luteimonas rhizosphaericola]
MKFSDLGGVSKPLTRLIDVISRGMGRVSAPMLTRVNAKADAEKIRVLSEALNNAGDGNLLAISYQDENIRIDRDPQAIAWSSSQSSAAERAATREAYQAELRQSNIESITTTAALELAGVTDVSTDVPDADWINRFFRASEDISSEQMQDLWGRILAGEIVRPGSFSLRTLDFVRNLTTDDASLLERMANQAVSYSSSTFVPCLDRTWLEKHRDIYMGHYFDAAELGAMHPSEMTYNLFKFPTRNVELLRAGKLVLKIERGTATKPIGLPLWRFTAVGREIVQLLSHDGDEEQLIRVGKWFAGKGADVVLGETIDEANGKIRMKNLQRIILDP